MMNEKSEEEIRKQVADSRFRFDEKIKIKEKEKKQILNCMAQTEGQI